VYTAGMSEDKYKMKFEKIAVLEKLEGHAAYILTS
jgi:hypothetical protein